MAKIIYPLFSLLIMVSLVHAQSGVVRSENTSVNSPRGIYPSDAHFAPVALQHTECIPDDQRAIALERIAENKKQILANNPNALRQTKKDVSFILPIQAKEGFDDYGYYTLNFQVDHNLTPNNNLTDYHCGQRTYDWSNGNHEGSDYILWPYPWKSMQEEVMEIVAAAAGTIIDKRDGFFDMNCSNTGNPNWNGIVLEHADGSQTWYWHFKNGAITDKEIGDSVEAGEYLGAAGSSGSSNWPHLHFEVHNSDGDLIDPYAGSCNNMNAESWWAEQPDYNIPTINRLSTHYTTAFDEDCPEIENTYEEVNFNPGDLLVIRLFFRDIQANDPVHITVFDPDENIYSEWTWNQNWGQDYATALAYWQFDVTTAWPEGIYNIVADFGGNTYETEFGVGTTIGIEKHEALSVEIFPNPVGDYFNFNAETPVEHITVSDVYGHVTIDVMADERSGNIDTRSLKNGVYFVRFQINGSIVTEKIVKE
ncbi:MAG: peptidoglycan DD-metalloendopeptidase family protein [Bacteroidales bacterium]|nr:peptidoglycan DD-metalloendopeptidase family protein [Bacteroidales bacterium]